MLVQKLHTEQGLTWAVSSIGPTMVGIKLDKLLTVRKAFFIRSGEESLACVSLSDVIPAMKLVQ